MPDVGERAAQIINDAELHLVSGGHAPWLTEPDTIVFSRPRSSANTSTLSPSYVFTNVLEDDEEGARQYDRIRSLAHRRGSLFLSVMLDCDVDEQVRRIDNPDWIARLKGSDPEGYRRHRHRTKLYQAPAGEVEHIDTTKVGARRNAERIYGTLLSRGLRRTDA